MKNMDIHAIEYCVRQSYIAVTNTGDNQLIERKCLFWLTVLEVSIQDWFTL
jgi:hypothetical protein